MPILASSTYTNAYGGSGGVVAIVPLPLDSMDNGQDIFIVKYDTLGKPLWTARIASSGNGNDEQGYAITTDSAGNVYVTGMLTQHGSMFNSDGTIFTSIFINTSAEDVFIAKYSSNGQGRWIARIGSSTRDIGRGITTDLEDNVYVIGSTGTTVATVFSSDGTAFAALTNAGSNDAFLVKYNTSGIVQWTTTIASGTADIGNAIAIQESTGDIYVTGQGGSGGGVIPYSSNAVAFGTLQNSGSSDAFVVKYNANGIVQWMARIGSSQSDSGNGIAVDASGVYVTGQGGTGVVVSAFSSNTVVFPTTLANSGGTDAFIVKYNHDGIVQWVARFASGGSDIGHAITTDQSGDVYVVGQGGSNGGRPFSSNGTQFGTTISSDSSSSHAFIVKYNTSGIVQWVAAVTSTGTDIGYGIATDSANNVYMTGGGLSTVTRALNANGTIFASLANNGNDDAFIIKYNSSGVGQWLRRLASNGFDIARGVTVDKRSNIITTGAFRGGQFSVYGATRLFSTIAAVGGIDTFLVKYNTNGNPQWATRLASPGQDLGGDVTTDLVGNVYTVHDAAGSQTTIITNSDGTTGGTIVNARASVIPCIVKYNSSGFVQWLVRMIATNDSSSFIYSVATDSIGNVYMTGRGATTGTTVLYNSDGTTFATVPPNGGNGDTLIAKYNADGFVQWVARIFSNQQEYGFGIATDLNGNVYVTGQGGSGATMTAVSADGVSFPTTIANSGGTDAFVVKYNTTGTVQWVTRIASSTGDIGLKVATDPTGNLYVTGQYGTTTATVFNSDGTSLARTAIALGLGDIFVVKYNTDGISQWLSTIRTTESEGQAGVAVDLNGNVYIACRGGASLGSVTNSDGTTYQRTFLNDGLGDSLIVKYNTNGFVQWITSIASVSADFMTTIKVDSFNNVYVSGTSGLANNSTSIYNADGSIFARVWGQSSLVKYNANGQVQWTQFINGGGGAMATDSFGDVYLRAQPTTGLPLQIYNRDNKIYLSISALTSSNVYIVKYSSTVIPQWIARLSTTSVNPSAVAATGLSITSDSNGNIYATGSTGSGDTLTAFNTDGTAFANVIGNSGDRDVFIVKYNTNGMVQWTTRIASAGSDVGHAIATDASGNVYVVGEGQGPVIFSSNNVAFATLANSGFSDGFVVKYNTDGIVQWTSRITSTSADSVTGIAVEAGGDFFITGTNFNAASVVNSSGTTTLTLPHTGAGDAFLVRYNTSGIAQWRARVASAGGERGIAVATTPFGGPLIVGHMINGGATFFNANATQSTTVGEGNSQNVFIGAYNSIGTVEWGAWMSPSPQPNEVFGVVCDSGGNVYLTGTANGGLLLAYSVGATTTSVSIATCWGYIVKYSASGVIQWAARIGRDEVTIGYSVKVDSAGDVYVTGQTASTFGFAAFNSDGTFFGSSSQPDVDRGTGVFMVKYNPAGRVQWLTRLNGGGSDQGRGITLDPSGNIYQIGDFGSAGFVATNA